MLDFDDSRTEFKVKGQVYYINQLTLDDAAYVAGFQSASQSEQIDAMKELLVSKARCDRSSFGLWLRRKPSPQAAVRSLGAVQQARLFGEWMAEFRSSRGVVPGESSGSAN